MKLRKVNLAEKLATFSDYFSPRVAAELNGQHVKLVKFRGEFVWHHHDNEDEMFLVLSGSFTMQLRPEDGGDIEVNAGEFIVIPRGVEHRPTARDEVAILLFEPATTLNTGNVESDLTRHELERI